MKKVFLLAAIAAMPFIASAQELKFGYVNADQLLSLMPEISGIEKEMADYNAINTQYLQGMEDTIRDEQAKLDEMMSDTSGKYTNKMKSDKQEDLQNLYVRYQRSVSDINRDAQQKQMQLVQPVRDKLMAAIETVSKKNNFFMVFNMDSDAVVYKSDKAVDITPLVKKELGL